MALATGSRLGPYEIVASLGEGGMGEVYRARDPKLQRDVALKILPDSFATDAERVARFRREAQVLASLNHPNIGHIYGFEDSGPSHALVLELIEGPTLADRVAQGPIPITEAVAIARQIADALETAHEQAIVHRDLKPANVKVKDDGTVKVLDFGLAKALDPAAASPPDALNSPTLTVRATEMGVILGTAAYMSPEQAKGKAVDRRADIWAFGAVLYEMLAGRRVFEGDDVSDTLAAVLRQEVDWTTLPPNTPPPLRRLLERCLERDVRQRLRDIGEARILLESPEAAGALSANPMTDRGQHVERPKALSPSARVAAITGAVAVVAAAAAAGWYSRQVPVPEVIRFGLTLPEGQQLVGTGRHAIALSPDGSQLVYAGSPARLYLRSMGDLDAKPLPGTDGFRNLTSPVFSPDGKSIVFYAGSDNTLKRVSTSGGAAVTICRAANPNGLSWGADGIVFGQPEGIMRVSSNGGEPEVIVPAATGEVLAAPQTLPGGRFLLFTVAGRGTTLTRWDEASIVVQELFSGRRETLVDGGTDGRYLASGHLLFLRRGSLMAATFDAERRQLTGEPVLVLEGVRLAGNSGEGQFAVSENGSLLFVPGAVDAARDNFDLAFVDRTGTVTPFNLPLGPYLAPRISPDGKRVAFYTDDERGRIIWTYEPAGGHGLQPLTFDGDSRNPIWSADSTRIIFHSNRTGSSALFWQAADGTGHVEQLIQSAATELLVPHTVAPGGELVVYEVIKQPISTLWTVSLRDKSVAQLEGISGTNLRLSPVFSPDGRWLAYVGGPNETITVFVEPWPRTGSKYQLVARPGDSPVEMVWSPDGKELFYNPRPDALEVVTVTTTPRFGFGKPLAVPKPFRTETRSGRRQYDMAPDGRFVGVISSGAESEPRQVNQLRIVINWIEELRQRVPPR